jgi:hypothetical protein
MTVSTFTEVAGFVLTCVCLFFMFGVWAALLPLGLVAMFVGFVMGADE